MNKPQGYEGIVLNEESFSEKFDNIWESVTEKMSDADKEGIEDIVYQAYKEGYVDAWEKALFMMR